MPPKLLNKSEHFMFSPILTDVAMPTSARIISHSFYQTSFGASTYAIISSLVYGYIRLYL
ncbi:hypothetical protein E4U52_000404 [Claviceps spartinae]|nr:hypothetical protein E4U52_000404 [Claviceps spartinae]